MGAKANAYTTDDYTAFHLNFAKEDLPRVMEIESDRFQNLHYGNRPSRPRRGPSTANIARASRSPSSC